MIPGTRQLAAHGGRIDILAVPVMFQLTRTLIHLSRTRNGQGSILFQMRFKHILSVSMRNTSWLVMYN